MAITSTASAAAAAATATNASAAVTSAAQTAGLGFTNDVQTFLKLLTTQLQNQDPTSPMDAQQLTAQLAQLSGVEQQIAANRNLESLISLQQSSQLLAATPLVGERVEVELPRLALQNGSAALRLPAGNGTATVTVTNAAGAVLRQQEVALGATEQLWSWDGRTVTNGTGARLADGAYAVSVTQPGSTGGTSALPFGVLGQVSGVTRGADGALVSVGALQLDLSKLTRVVPQG